jgi:hypothetical protein
LAQWGLLGWLLLWLCRLQNQAAAIGFGRDSWREVKSGLASTQGGHANDRLRVSGFQAVGILFLWLTDKTLECFMTSLDGKRNDRSDQL